MSSSARKLPHTELIRNKPEYNKDKHSGNRAQSIVYDIVKFEQASMQQKLRHFDAGRHEHADQNDEPFKLPGK